MGEKRKRFSADEVSFLNRLVWENREIIENKETDVVSVKAKKKVWEIITSKFNAEPSHTPRTVGQLSKCWDNMKTKRKRELAGGKKPRMSEDGDSSIITPNAEIINGEEIGSSGFCPTSSCLLPSTSTTLKNKTPRALAVAAAIKERTKLNQERREQGRELHEIRLAELQTRLDIAKECLKRAQLETEHKRELWELEKLDLRKKLALSTETLQS